MSPLRRPPAWRLVAWALVLLTGACAATRVGPRHPQDEVAALVAAIEADEGRSLYYQGDSSVVGIHSRCGWTMTLYVGHAPAFAPAEFLVLTRLEGVRRGALLLPPDQDGAMREVVLTGDALEVFLERAGLDPSLMDYVHAARYGGRR